MRYDSVPAMRAKDVFDNVQFIKIRKAWSIILSTKKFLIAQRCGLLFQEYWMPDPRPILMGRAYLPDSAFKFYTFAEAAEINHGDVLPDNIGFYPQGGHVSEGDTIGNSHTDSEAAMTSNDIIYDKYWEVADMLMEYDNYYTMRKDGKLITNHMEARLLKESGSRLKY